MGTIKRDNSDWGKMKVIVFVWKEHKGQILIWPFAYYLTGHFVFLFLKHSWLLLIFGNVVIWKVAYYIFLSGYVIWNKCP
jgi:hypothetical protein